MASWPAIQATWRQVASTKPVELIRRQMANLGCQARSCELDKSAARDKAREAIAQHTYTHTQLQLLDITNGAIEFAASKSGKSSVESSRREQKDVTFESWRSIGVTWSGFK